MKKILKRLRKSIFKKFGLEVVPIENNPLKYYYPEATEFELKLIKLCSKFSMTGYDRLFCLIKAIEHIVYNKLEGDFVECGVWKGGNLILFQNMIEKFNLKDKKIYGFDTFDGMPEPSDFDSDSFIGGLKAKQHMNSQPKDINIDNIHCYATLDMVKNNYFNNTSKNVNLNLIKGKVEETLNLSRNISEKISILRLDTDWYESTKIELEILYPRLIKNGILIIDDYGEWTGSRKATDEYFRDKKIAMFKIDRGARLIFKN